MLTRDGSDEDEALGELDMEFKAVGIFWIDEGEI